MVVSRLIPASFGILAILATAVTVVVHVLVALSIQDSDLSLRTIAIVAAALEALVLVTICWFIFSHFGPWAGNVGIRKFSGISFGGSLLFCAVAAAVSVVAVVLLGASASSLSGWIVGSNGTGLLVGVAIALGLAFAMQLVFFVVHYVLGRVRSHEEAHSLHTEDGRNRSPQPQNVQSIPYHQTSSNLMKSEARTPPGSSSGRSATETMSSLRSSLSNVVRSISSKTRLLPGSQRSSRRPSSLDSNAFKERPSSMEDGFDSWDTSAVDPQNRQTVLENSSPPGGRFLETIPASPITSRSPSPGTPLDLEPPRKRRKSRSYSPAGARSRQALRATFTQQATVSESHIHPLFRSDSPTPPPIATPGTVVTAAPNAGRLISDRNSIRNLNLNRMRSGSLPPAPSPLSRQGSFDSFHHQRDSCSPELHEGLEEFPELEEERRMTPPIPDWILSAGQRSSFKGYNSRKLRSADGQKI